MAIGFLVLGMGHGWDVPLRFSLYGFVFFPAALALLTRGGGKLRLLDLILTGAAILVGLVLAGDLLTSGFHRGDYSSIGPPYVPAGAIAAAGIALGLWARHAGQTRLWPELTLLTIAFLSDLALWYEARYGDSIWHYRGDFFEHLWLFLWSLWQWAVLAALAARTLSGEEQEAVDE